MSLDSSPDGIASSHRIVLVGGEPAERAARRAALAPHAAEIVEAENASDALQLLSSTEDAYDLAVVDQRTPVLPGLTLIRALQEMGTAAVRRFVLVVDPGDDAVRREAEGRARCLTRPPSAADLLEAIDGRDAEASPGSAAADSDDAPGAAVSAPRAAPQRAAAGTPARALVVDDNAVNRGVAQQMMGLLGFESDTAQDGREAVEAVRAGAYDVVLMDCHMPVMSGHDAVRAIRREQLGGAALPIIAVTADVTPENQAECVEAGMDALITKPLRLKRLTAALEEVLPSWTPPTRGPVSGPPAAGASPSGAARLSDGGVDVEAAANAVLQDAGVRQAFVTTTEELLAQLRSAAAAADAEGLTRAAHSLAGSAGMFSDALTTQARLLEALGRTGRLDGAVVLIERLETTLQEVRHEWQQHGARRDAR